VAGGGTSTVGHLGQRALRVPPRGRDLRGRGSGDPRLPSPRRLQAQAAQPHEVPHPRAGLGRWRAEFEKELQTFRDEAAAPFSFPPDHPPVESAPDWPGAGRAPPWRSARRGRVRRRCAGPGSCRRPPAPSCRPCATTSTGRARTCGRSARPDIRW
jgi:hypothetical protein